MRVEPHAPAAAVAPHHARELCVCLGGGAWASLFYLGVLEALQRRFSSGTLEQWAFCGESAGAVYALAACLGMPFEELQKLYEGLVREVGQRPCGIVGRSLELTGALVDKVINWVDEAELVRRLKGRFAVTFASLEWHGFAPYLAYDFESREEVRNALHGSANVPGLMPPFMTPRLGGRLAFDAGFHSCSRVPVLPCKRAIYVVCVSPLRSDKDGTLWGAPLPRAISVDIQPLLHVPIWKMLVTPRTVEDIVVYREAGLHAATQFFESDRWHEFACTSCSVPSATATCDSPTACSESSCTTLQADDVWLDLEDDRQSDAGSDLASADCEVAHLTDTHLTDTHLTDTHLTDTHLTMDWTSGHCVDSHREPSPTEAGCSTLIEHNCDGGCLELDGAELRCSGCTQSHGAAHRCSSTQVDDFPVAALAIHHIKGKRVRFHHSVVDPPRRRREPQHVLTGMPSSTTACSVMMLVSIILTIAIRELMQPESSRALLPDVWMPHVWAPPLHSWLDGWSHGEHDWISVEERGASMHADEYVAMTMAQCESGKSGSNPVREELDASSADLELRTIISTNDMERIDEAISRMQGAVSPASLAEARRARDRLKDKAKKVAEEARRSAEEARRSAKEAAKKAAQRAAEDARRVDDTKRAEDYRRQAEDKRFEEKRAPDDAVRKASQLRHRHLDAKLSINEAEQPLNQVTSAGENPNLILPRDPLEGDRRDLTHHT